jgi:hypothetical protein
VAVPFSGLFFGLFFGLFSGPPQKLRARLSGP